MYVVFFGAKLDQPAAPGGEAIGENFPCAVPHRFRERFSPVFGHKDQMVLHVENGVISSLCHLRSPFEPFISNGMQTGNRFRCYPTPEQAQTLFRWIGCQRFIYNAKVSEDRYYRAFARRLAGNAGQHAPIDQEYSRFIGPETAWLREVPSQVLRNGAVRWRQAYARFFAKLGGRPKFRPRHGAQSVWLTSELFAFDVAGNLALRIGTRKCPGGELAYARHRGHDLPASIRIVADSGRWYLTFSTDDGAAEYDEADIAAWLAGFERSALLARTVGLDRGVVIPLAASNGLDFDFEPVHKQRMRKKVKQRVRWQRRIARREKTSARRGKAKLRAAATQRYGKDVRRDFAHKASHALVSDPRNVLFVFENLKIANMTASAKGTTEASGRNVRQKAGLNRSILGAAWGQTRTFTAYKARRAHKLSIDVTPYRSSQECAACGCINPDNRQSQSRFVCHDCGSIENADRNASRVVARRGVDLILSGKWKPKERKRAGIRKDDRAGMVRIGGNPSARGEQVSHGRQPAAAHRSVSRETLATAEAA
jgi:putative transposase